MLARSCVVGKSYRYVSVFKSQSRTGKTALARKIFRPCSYHNREGLAIAVAIRVFGEYGFAYMLVTCQQLIGFYMLV